ncbi:hypothetical protein ACJX0J_019739, partial [Zea mays]
ITTWVGVHNVTATGPQTTYTNTQFTNHKNLTKGVQFGPTMSNFALSMIMINMIISTGSHGLIFIYNLYYKVAIMYFHTIWFLALQLERCIIAVIIYE